MTGGSRKTGRALGCLIPLFGGVLLAVLAVYAGSLLYGINGHSTAKTLLYAAIGAAFLTATWRLTENHRPWLHAVLVGALLSEVVFYFGGVHTTVEVWEATPVPPSNVRAVGAWVVGDVVVRARPDLVRGYRIAEGQRIWTWTPPGRDTVCAMSESTAEGIGLIGYSPTGKPCGTITALDLATGTPRWTKSVNAADRTGDSARAGILAIAGKTAVIQETADWRGVDLSSGAAGWQVNADHGCIPAYLAGGPDRAVTVENCPNGSPILRSLSSAGGTELARSALPVTSALRNLAVLSTNPVVVWVDEEAMRGTHAILSYDRQGRVRAAIPISADGHELSLTILGSSLGPATAFPARPDWGPVVAGDLLIAPAVEPGDEQVNYNHSEKTVHYVGRLVAYSLTDGRRRWTAELDDRATGLALSGAGVWALGQTGLTYVEARTGRVSSLDMLNDASQVKAVELWVSGDLFIRVAEDGTRKQPPVLVEKRTVGRKHSASAR